jgi:RNA polymerase sigma-70 factor (ECF subfamily)
MDGRQMGREIVGLLPRLRRFALALTRSSPEADDLVQSAVERAISRAGQIREEDRLDRWMFSILRTSWLNARRAAALRTTEALEGHEDAWVVDGARAMEASLDLGRVRAAFDRLPEDQRAALVLVCLEGCSYAEASQILDIPVGTLTSRLARGRAALADVLTPGPPSTLAIFQRRRST